MSTLNQWKPSNSFSSPSLLRRRQQRVLPLQIPASPSLSALPQIAPASSSPPQRCFRARGAPPPSDVPPAVFTQYSRHISSVWGEGMSQMSVFSSVPPDQTIDDLLEPSTPPPPPPPAPAAAARPSAVFLSPQRETIFGLAGRAAPVCSSPGYYVASILSGGGEPRRPSRVFLSPGRVAPPPRYEAKAAAERHAAGRRRHTSPRGRGGGVRARRHVLTPTHSSAARAVELKRRGPRGFHAAPPAEGGEEAGVPPAAKSPAQLALEQTNFASRLASAVILPATEQILAQVQSKRLASGGILQ